MIVLGYSTIMQGVCSLSWMNYLQQSKLTIFLMLSALLSLGWATMLETRKLQFQTIISFVMIEIDMVEASSSMLRTPTSLQCCLMPPLIWKSLLFVYKVEIVKLAFHFFIDLPVLLQLFLILFVNIWSHSTLSSILILFAWRF